MLVNVALLKQGLDVLLAGRASLGVIWQDLLQAEGIPNTVAVTIRLETSTAHLHGTLCLTEGLWHSGMQEDQVELL